MRIGVLTRYLVGVHVGPFLFALTAVTALLVLNAAVQRADSLVGKGLPWGVVVEFLVLSLPHTLALSLPMTVLAAVPYAFNELASKNEMTNDGRWRDRLMNLLPDIARKSPTLELRERVGTRSARRTAQTATF